MTSSDVFSSSTDETCYVFYNGICVEIPKKDLWFYNDLWQVGERDADEQIKNGKVEHFDTFEDFINSLA
jgi:hypothetical protein